MLTSLALKTLFKQFHILIEPADIKRMSYDTFEQIFYHLFILYDSNGFRKKFEHCYPARDRDQKRLFSQKTIECLQQINMPNVKIIPGHINALGGPHFHKILSALIIVTMKSQIGKLRAHLGLAIDNNSAAADFNSLINEYEKNQELLSQKIEEYNTLSVHLKDDHEDLHLRIDREQNHWNNLCDELHGYDLPVTRASSTLLFKSLDIKMKDSAKMSAESNQRLELFRKIITKIEPAQYETPSLNENNELSDTYKKIRNNLRFSIEGSPAGTRSTVIAVDAKLTYLEEELESLSNKLDDEIKSSEDNLLKKPEYIAKLQFWENNIPNITLPSIGARQADVKISFERIKEILDQHRGPESEDEDIDEVLKKFCCVTNKDG